MIGSKEGTDIKSRILYSDSPVSIFLKQQELYKHKVFFVVDELQRYIGTVTDGDLRSFILGQSCLPQTILEITNMSSKFITEEELAENEIYPFVNAFSGEFPVISSQRKVVGIFPRYSSSLRPISIKQTVTAMAFENWRFNLRQSNTEPLVRLNVETRGDRLLLREKTEELKRVIKKG